MPKWIGLLIEYFVTAWKDRYKAAKRFLGWLEHDPSKKAVKMNEKAKEAESRLDQRLNEE